MLVFEWVIVVLLGAVVLSAFAQRISVPYPSMLALGGVALAFVPGSPEWTLDPQLALALFVAPVLLDAAYDTSPRDLRDNWAPVTSMVIGAVAVTTAAVALVAHAMVPDLPWAAAIALGAAVAPPDAAAASAVLKQLRLPHRIVTILEGESLLNDASALLIYRVAVGAVAAGSFAAWDIAPAFLFAVVGSLIVGPLCAWVSLHILPRMEDAPSAIIVQFGTTFAIWIAAERLGLSGILTIVSYAITIARDAPKLTPARIRVPSYAVWDAAVFILNVLAFVMIGLQVRPVWERLSASDQSDYGLVAAAVLATVVVVRFVWVMSHNSVLRFCITRHGFHPRRPMAQPTLYSGLIISWCGMRGIVTLAAAFALPNGDGGGPAFPHRDLIVLCAFAVVVGTLVLQGLTLRPLLKRAAFSGDDPVQREVERGGVVAYRAALDAIDGDSSPEAEVLRREFTYMLKRAESDPEGHLPPELPTDPLRRRTLAAARDAVVALRERGEIGDDAFHRIEEELDRAELSAAPARRD